MTDHTGKLLAPVKVVGPKGFDEPRVRMLRPQGAPYSSDGMMDQRGRFFPVCSGCHDAWAYDHFGVCESELTRAGWVTIWSYQSIFLKGPTPSFRFDYDRVTKSQKDALVDWCRARRVSLRRAFGEMMLDVVFPDRPSPKVARFWRGGSSVFRATLRLEGSPLRPKL